MKRMILIIGVFIFLNSTLSGQYKEFSEDTVPVRNGKVVFKINFISDISKDNFHEIANRYLNYDLSPQRGEILIDNADYTVCKITDYINIVSSSIQEYGMYCSYNLILKYQDGFCVCEIRDISFMQKSHFEADVNDKAKESLPTYSGKDIMIDHNYSVLLIKNTSERLTSATLKRFNTITGELQVAFSQ